MPACFSSAYFLMFPVWINWCFKSFADVATGEAEAEGVPVARRRALEEQEAQQKVELSKVEALLEALAQMDLSVS